jgi:Ca2+/Na+ antiporter
VAYLDLTLLQLISTIAALYFITTALCDLTSKLGTGKLFSWVIVPTLTTLPETITSVVLALDGFDLAALYNLAYSAVFDVCIMLLYFAYRRLPAYPVMAMLLGLGVFGLVVSYGYIAHGYCCIDYVGAVILIIALLILTGLPALEPIRITISRRELGVNLVLTLFNLAALVMVSYELSLRVEAFAVKLGEEIAGVLAAYITSIPDALYAAVASEKLSVEEGLAELAACVIHDFCETPAIMAYAKTIELGQPVPVDMTLLVPVTIVVTGLLTVMLVKPRLMVDAKKILILLALFAVATLYGIGRI